MHTLMTNSISILTIEEKMLYGTYCLENFCIKYNIVNHHIDDLIAYLRSIFTYEYPDAWHEDLESISFLGDLWDIPPDLDAVVPEDVRNEFYDLAAEVYHIGSADLYACPSQAPYDTLMRVISVLKKNDISLPDIELARTGKKSIFPA